MLIRVKTFILVVSWTECSCIVRAFPPPHAGCLLPELSDKETSLIQRNSSLEEINLEPPFVDIVIYCLLRSTGICFLKKK